MAFCAKQESVAPETIRKGVEDGTIVVVRNNRQYLDCGHGHRQGPSGRRSTPTSGTSKDRADVAHELEKVRRLHRSGHRYDHGPLHRRRSPGDPPGHHRGTDALPSAPSPSTRPPSRPSNRRRRPSSR
ncbi:MAG: hypothetical protein MZU91_04675 [Desulfosudis oleivorans]|nr:hypothetical protein [Desulfosudis oleivorans]